jgi:hypothetical protein
METRFNGLWSMEFVVANDTGERGLGYGVAVISGIGLMGGNSEFCWSGRYHKHAGRMQLDLFQMATHSGAPAASVSGGNAEYWTAIARGVHLGGDSPTDAMDFKVSGIVAEKDEVSFPLTIRFVKRQL